MGGPLYPFYAWSFGLLRNDLERCGDGVLLFLCGRVFVDDHSPTASPDVGGSLDGPVSCGVRHSDQVSRGVFGAACVGVDELGEV